jgi:hypothetical protein
MLVTAGSIVPRSGAFASVPTGFILAAVARDEKNQPPDTRTKAASKYSGIRLCRRENRLSRQSLTHHRSSR